jgi:2-polyprenyl-3-methyl-5-hydroxy-6-metoxy-1,4-benzoquinol methylase
MIARPSDQYVVPLVLKKVREIFGSTPATLLDAGCGEGYAANQLRQAGFAVKAFDASEQSIETARARYPDVSYEVRSVYDDLASVYGSKLDGVVSLEVVEHLYYPRRLFEESFKVLRPGGWLILSTPYHGYFKNLALSLVDGWDRHFDVTWDGGHVKFFSDAALATMAAGTGFHRPKFFGVGRAPYLWKSTILVVQKP